MLKFLLPCFLFYMFFLSAQQPLVFNGGFEEGKPKRFHWNILPGWEVSSYKDSCGGHYIVPDNSARGGRHAVIRFEKETEHSGFFAMEKQHLFPVSRGKNYRLTFRAKYIPGNNDTKAFVRIDGFTEQKAFIGEMRKETPLLPSKAWKTYTMDYQAPSGRQEKYFLRAVFFLHGIGELFLDDVSITEIPVKKVRFFPASVNDTGRLQIVPGELAPLYLYLFGITSPATLFLDTPAEIELLDTVPVYAGKAVNPPFFSEKTKNTKHYKIPLSPNLFPARNNMFTGQVLVFSASNAVKEGTIQWRIANKDMQILESGTFKIFPVHLPKTELPKNFRIYSWWVPYLNHSQNISVCRRMIKQLRQDGITGGSTARPSRPSREKTDLFNQMSWTVLHTYWHESQGELCLTKFITDGSLEKLIKRQTGYLQGFRQKYFVWNYEPTKEYFHFCPLCRDAFAKFSGKNASRLKSGTEAEKKYPVEYMAFRDEQFRILMQKTQAIATEKQCPFIFDSYMLHCPPDAPEYLSIRRKMGNIYSYGGLIDCYSPQLYTTTRGIWKCLETLRQHYHGKMIPTFDTGELRGPSFQAPYYYAMNTADRIRCGLLQTAVFRIREVLLFEGIHNLDASARAGIREALSIIALTENHLFEGKETEKFVNVCKTSPNIKVIQRELHGEKMVMFLNILSEKEQNILFRFSSIENGAVLVDPVRKIRILNTSGSDVFLRIPPGNARVFMMVDRQTAERYPAVMLPAKPDNPNIRPLFSNSKWQIQNTEDEIVIRNGTRSLSIGYCGATVLSWKDRLREMVLGSDPDQDGLFRNFFWKPESSRGNLDAYARYRLEECSAEGNELNLIFSWTTKRPPAGLLIRKHYRLSDGLREIACLISLKNNAQEDAEFALWIHNRPNVEKKDFRYQIGELPECKVPPTGTDLFLPAKSSVLRIGDIVFHASLDQLEQYYFWFGNFPTGEMILKSVTLKPDSVWKTSLRAVLQESL